MKSWPNLQNVSEARGITSRACSVHSKNETCPRKHVSLDALSVLGFVQFILGGEILTGVLECRLLLELGLRDIPIVFVTPHHVGQYCTNSIRGRCTLGHFCTNEIRCHCCAILTPVIHVAYHIRRNTWQMGEPIRCSSHTVGHKEHNNKVLLHS